MSQHELMPAITVLERRVTDAERKVNELLGALNILREEAGLPPRPPGHGLQGETASAPTQIKPDSFFGKKQQTAIREFLTMRRAQGLGPAKPREIYEALVAGGYQYEAKDAETALVGVRSLLRKRSNVFIKVGNSAYGLTAWYPDAKRPKEASVSKSEDDDDDATEDSATAVSSNDDEDAAVA